MTEGTDLYHRVMAHEGPRQELMRKIWKPTPWMIEVYTGSAPDDRMREIVSWCLEHLGQPEASVIHGHEGTWQRGCATVCGWTWFGFATRELMEQFLAAWPPWECPDCGDTTMGGPACLGPCGALEPEEHNRRRAQQRRPKP